jgi:glutamine synthetase
MDSWGMVDEAERHRRAVRARTVAADLAERGPLDAVALTWVDNTGITRVKAVPLRRLEHAAAWGVGMSPCFDTFLLDDTAVPAEHAGGPVGDLRLLPDLDRITPLAAQPGWAWAPADRYRQDGAPHPLDARSLARREAERLCAAGYAVRMAFEVEWCVSVGFGDDFEPACSGPAYGMARLIERSGYLRDLLEALAAQDVAVDQIHPEYAAGQYELSVAAEDPVGAADTFVLVRETIRAVSAAHGLRATFAPKVLAGGVGNGAHVHLSVWQGEGEQTRNMMSGGDGTYGLTGDGEAFAGGILGHLPALLALGAPAVASYLRLIPSHWAGAFACWGLENREAALRFVTGSQGEAASAANLEIKCFDAAANPYLLAAGLLAAGRAGLAARATLPEPIEADPATLAPEQAAKRDIRALPSSLAGSVAAFEADDVFIEAFGARFVDTIAAVRRGEIEFFADAGPQRVVASSRWKY